MSQERRRKPRRSRGGAPVRTPVEGTWLRLHRATGLAYLIDANERGVRTRIYFGAYYGDVERRIPSAAAVERASRWIRERRVLGNAPRTSTSGPLTVAGLSERFLAHAREYYGAESNEVEFYTLVLDIACGLYGSTPAEEFGPLALKAVRSKMLETDRWGRETLNAHIGRLKRAFRWAASNELVPAAIYNALATVEGLRKGRTTAREPGKVLPVSSEHVDAVLPHVARHVRAMIELQRLTGMRPGEVAIMRPCDIDRSSSPWTYQPARHKLQHAGLGRVVYLGPRAQGVLTPFLLREADAYCFSPAEAEEERLKARHAARITPVGVGNTRGTNRTPEPERAPGDRYTTASYRVAIQRGCARAGVPEWHPNQLRHSAATDLRRRYGIEAARVTLGHTDASTTTIYAEQDIELARRVAAEVG